MSEKRYDGSSSPGRERRGDKALTASDYLGRSTYNRSQSGDHRSQGVTTTSSSAYFPSSGTSGPPGSRGDGDLGTYSGRGNARVSISGGVSSRSESEKKDFEALPSKVDQIMNKDKFARHSDSPSAPAGTSSGKALSYSISGNKYDHKYAEDRDEGDTGIGVRERVRVYDTASKTTHIPTLTVQPSSMGSDSQVSSNSTPAISDDLTSYIATLGLRTAEQAISMGSKAKIVPGGELSHSTRQSSYKLDAEEGKVVHQDAPNLSGSVPPYSHLTPEGSIAGHGILSGGSLEHYKRSTSSPVNSFSDKHLRDKFPGGEDSINLSDSRSSQAVGDETGEQSHLCLREGSIGLKHSISYTSSSSECRYDYSNQMSSGSQSSRASDGRSSFSKDRGKNRSGVHDHYLFLRRQQSEQERQHKAELLRKEMEIKMFKEEMETIQKKCDLLDKDFDKQSDSYFEEITKLTEQLSAYQAEVGKLRLDLADFDELKRRSKFLEEQASSAGDMLMKLQEENQMMVTASIQGTEEMDRPQGDAPVISAQELKKVQMDFKLKEQQMADEIAQLREALNKKEENVKKLKARVTETAAKLTQPQEEKVVELDLSGERIYKDRLKEAEIEIEKLQNRLAGQTGTGTVVELESENEKLSGELRDLRTRYNTLLRFAEETSSQAKAVQGSLEEKEIKFQIVLKEKATLAADNEALKDVLSQNDKEMSEIGKKLQEAETERTEFEIQCGRLHKQVEEGAKSKQRYTEELNGVRVEQQKLVEQLQRERNEMQSVIGEKRKLEEELTLHQTRATIFEQDFHQERQDREKAHSKHIEAEDRYKHQLDSLAAQLQAVTEELRQQKKTQKDMEAEYQARLSQQSYSVGDKDRRLQMAEQRSADLEGDIATKTQQLKQYKKQADHLRDELNTHKEVHEVQKLQLEKLSGELEATKKELTVLQHENRNMKARISHAAATGRASGGGSLTSVSDSKRMQELERTVEALQMRNAELQSQLDIAPTINKAAPISSPSPPVFSSSASSSSTASRDRSSKISALPNRAKLGPIKAQSMEEELLHRGNHPRNRADLGASNLQTHQMRDDFSYNQRQPHQFHDPRRAMTSIMNPASSNADLPPPSTSGMAGGINVMTPPTFNVSQSAAGHSHNGQSLHQPRTSAGMYQQPAVVPSRPGGNSSLLPAGTSGYAPPPASTSTSGYYKNSHSDNSGMPQGTMAGSLHQLKLHPMTQQSSSLSPIHSPGYSSGMSGPASLPGSNLPPMVPLGGKTENFAPRPAMMGRQEAQYRPHSHQVVMQKNQHVNEDPAIVGAPDSVEKDSPPSSLSEQAPPRPMNLSASLQPSRRNYPGNERQNYAGADRHNHLGIERHNFPGSERPKQPPALLSHGKVVGGVQHGSKRGDVPANMLHSQQDYLAMMGRGIGRSQPVHHQGMGSTLGGNGAMKNAIDPRISTSSTASRTEGLGRRPLQESVVSMNPQMQESVSDSNVVISPNQLEEGIDDDIVAAAKQVGGTGKGGAASENAPFDPNLECPSCGQPFRIGQIQAFREHASSCVKRTT